MIRFSVWKRSCYLSLLSAATAIVSCAQMNTLANFDGANGANPYNVSLVQGTNGGFYGTTTQGNGYGSLFEITRLGSLTSLHNFDDADGSAPLAGMVLSVNGNLYGTTYGGGVNGYGTVFKMSPKGTIATLYGFCAQKNCADGSSPQAALVQASDGNFYGTTQGGGNGEGVVFKITASGKFTTLYKFCSQSNCADGYNSYAALIQATDGDLYGTTKYGGFGGGTVFKITTGGTFTKLYSFCAQPNCTDGIYPVGGLVQAQNGNFYGTTENGGSSVNCSNGCGTVFEITAKGTLTTLHSFSATDGAQPVAGLFQATNGGFYGTTQGGGSSSSCTGGCGTLFKITATGTLTTLHSFDALIDGNSPDGALLQATDGNFYGTTASGGVDGYGTVFSLSVGLKPFISLVQSSGKVGSTVEILGQGFKGTSGVSFNGTPTTFTVRSNTYLTAAVPNAAITGFITVTTPSGKLMSNRKFRVTP